MLSAKFTFSSGELESFERYAIKLIRPTRKAQGFTEMVSLRWDRRRYPRIPVDLTARFRILRPRESYNAIALRGAILDLSRSGARAAVSNLLQADYQQILQNPQLRYISVRCIFPRTEVETRLFGSIVHFDYHGDDVEPACHLGIAFGEMEAVDRKNLIEFIESAA